MKNTSCACFLAFYAISGFAQSIKVSFDGSVKATYHVWESIQFPIHLQNLGNTDISFTVDGTIYLPDGRDARLLDPNGAVTYSDGHTSLDFAPWNADDYPAKTWKYVVGVCVKPKRSYLDVGRASYYNIFPDGDWWFGYSRVSFPLPTGDYVFNAVVRTYNGERYVLQHKFAIVEADVETKNRYKEFYQKQFLYRHELVKNPNNTCVFDENKIILNYLDTCQNEEAISKVATLLSNISCDYQKDLDDMAKNLVKIKEKGVLLALLRSIAHYISPDASSFYGYINLNKFEYVKKVIQILMKMDKSVAESFFGYIYEQEVYLNPNYTPEVAANVKRYVLTMHELAELESLLNAR